MSTKKQTIRSATAKVVDFKTVKILDESHDLKPDDLVVVIQADDYKNTFEKMLQRINEMDEKINDQTKLLKENSAHESKGFIGRFRKQ